MKTYKTNINDLTCSCLDWIETRKDYPIEDPRRLCKHIINKLDLENLPEELLYFKNSISYYQEQEWGFKRDFEQIIYISNVDCKVIYQDGGWSNIFDKNGNQYGFLITDTEFKWAKDTYPVYYKEIELFFSKKEYQSVIPLTQSEIKEIEDTLNSQFKVNNGNFVATIKERSYEMVDHKDNSLETYYDTISTTNTLITVTFQDKDYFIQRNQNIVEKEQKRLLELKKPKIYPKIDDSNLMMKYEPTADLVAMDTKLMADNFKYEWERKLKLHFESAVVDKGLMLKFESFKLPRFVSEYVVSNFIEQNGLKDGIVKVEEFLSAYCPKPNSTDMLHYKIQMDGEINIIDNFKVSVHIERHGNDHTLTIPTLNIKNAIIEDHDIILNNPRILGSGLWGMGKITRTQETTKAVLSKFRPFQVSSIDVNLYKSKREQQFVFC